MSVNIVFELVTVSAHFQAHSWQGLVARIDFIRVAFVNDSAVLRDFCDFAYEWGIGEKFCMEQKIKHEGGYIEEDHHEKEPGYHFGNVLIGGLIIKKVDDKVR